MSNSCVMDARIVLIAELALAGAGRQDIESYSWSPFG